MTRPAAPIPTRPIGAPLAITGLARLLLTLRSRPAVRVVAERQGVAA